MAEGTYEYECMRAELLGLEKPDYDEFMKNKQESEQKNVEEEEIDIETMKDIDSGQENLSRAHSGLDELNSILKKTQTKINRFKDSCGSFSSIIKSKVGSKWQSQSSMDGQNFNEQPEESETALSETENSTDTTENENSDNVMKSSRKSDLSKALDSDLSRLDTMIDKAENAQYSMSHQNKQMKKFLK